MGGERLERAEATRRQGRYWIFTIPYHLFTPYLPPGCVWSRGQLELGEGGFLHWQFISLFEKKVSLASVRHLYGNVHAELTRSESAIEYVWKEDTRVEGTQFEIGGRYLY